MKRYKRLACLLAAVLAVWLPGAGAALAQNSLADSTVDSHPGVEISGLGSHNVLVYLNGSGIINWRSFGVGSNETITYAFTTPGAVLNRVTGTEISQIAGTINAPGGKVFLVNPNGIVFSGGATINAQRFVASTLPVADADFERYATGASSTLFFGAGSKPITMEATPQIDGYVTFISGGGSAAAGLATPTSFWVPAGTNPVLYSDNGVAVVPVTTLNLQTAGSTAGSGGGLFAVIPPGAGGPTGGVGGTVGTGAGTPGSASGSGTGGTGGFGPGTSGGLGGAGMGPGTTGGFGGAGTGGAPGGATGSGMGGTGGMGPGTPGGAGGTAGTGPGTPGGGPTGDSSDRALGVVANPPPVQGAPQPTPRPPQTTTQLAQGLSQMVSGGTPPAGAGVPGIRGGFSSSGNPGRW